MANVTPVLSAAQYKEMLLNKPQGAARRQKYGNKKTSDGFDSTKEKRIFDRLELQKQAKDPSERVVLLERQKRYEVIPKQQGERATSYVADFYVEYSDGHIEVIDVKSSATRKIPSYVIKRKLMLERHGIKIVEI